MGYLRTFFNTVFIGAAAILWLVFSSAVAAPFLYFKRDKTARAVRKFVYIQSCGIVNFIRLASKSFKVESAPRPKGSCIVAANHASALDLYTISAFGFDNVLYITKGWVFKLPFFRYVMNGAGYIDAQKTPPEQMLALCRKAAEDGCDIVLFPQGSRKNPQARFKSGAFYLAQQLDLPIVPVALKGTQDMLPAGSFTIKAADIVLKSFGPVYPKDFNGEIGHLRMAQAVKKQIMDFVNGDN